VPVGVQYYSGLQELQPVTEVCMSPADNVCYPVQYYTSEMTSKTEFKMLPRIDDNRIIASKQSNNDDNDE